MLLVARSPNILESWRKIRHGSSLNKSKIIRGSFDASGSSKKGRYSKCGKGKVQDKACGERFLYYLENLQTSLITFSSIDSSRYYHVNVMLDLDPL